jgi:hypothetical protein
VLAEGGDPASAEAAATRAAKLVELVTHPREIDANE